jgi:hypothetical protein
MVVSKSELLEYNRERYQNRGRARDRVRGRYRMTTSVRYWICCSLGERLFLTPWPVDLEGQPTVNPEDCAPSFQLDRGLSFQARPPKTSETAFGCSNVRPTAGAKANHP